jgi:hypothetical protein
MCRVTVDVDQEVLMEIDPTLSDAAALRRWVQDLVNHRTRELVAEDAAMMDLETMRENLHQMVRDVYSQA